MLFRSFAENLNVEHLDVLLRLFVQSLDGEARKWFKTLADRSVDTWERMDEVFLRKSQWKIPTPLMKISNIT